MPTAAKLCIGSATAAGNRPTSRLPRIQLGVSRPLRLPASGVRRRYPSTLFFEQLTESPLLVVVEDPQNPGLSIAQHVPVIHTEIVEDHSHFLRLFGSQLEVPLPALEPDIFAAFGVEGNRPMHPLMS